MNWHYKEPLLCSSTMSIDVNNGFEMFDLMPSLWSAVDLSMPRLLVVEK